jgi:hypothetical protein
MLCYARIVPFIVRLLPSSFEHSHLIDNNFSSCNNVSCLMLRNQPTNQPTSQFDTGRIYHDGNLLFRQGSPSPLAK